MKNKYYNPNTGRFLSEDPIGFRGQDSNLFRYVENNPILKKDPTGQIGVLGAVGLGALAGGIGSVLAQGYVDGGFCNAGSAFVSGAVGGASAILLGGVGGAILMAGGSVGLTTGLSISGFSTVVGGTVGAVTGALINYGTGSAPNKCKKVCGE